MKPKLLRLRDKQNHSEPQNRHRNDVGGEKDRAAHNWLLEGDLTGAT
jgi:hypothetical protein